MNAPVQSSIANMTSKGQVLIPKTMRDRAGLVPGEPVRVEIETDGRVVVRPVEPVAVEDRERRRQRFRAAILAIGGRNPTGQTTADYMAMMRPRDAGE